MVDRCKWRSHRHAGPALVDRERYYRGRYCRPTPSERERVRAIVARTRATLAAGLADVAPATPRRPYQSLGAILSDRSKSDA